ncbi:MAG: oligosaccharide flippase family protein, partial [Streptosporangiaceae bacterium]
MSTWERAAHKVRARLEQSPLIARGGLSFFVAVSAANISNFVFHVIVSRLLGPPGYGALGALLNVLLVLSVPLGAVQAAVTQRVAEQPDGRARVLGLMLRGAAIGVTGAVAVIIVSPAVAGFLHLDSVAAVAVLAVWLVPAVIGALLQGVLIGQLRFKAVAVATVVGTVAGRLAFGIFLVGAGMGVVGAVAATVLGQALTCLLLAWVLRRELRMRGTSGVDLAWRDTLRSVLALSGYWAFAGIDTVLVRHFLPPREAGWYAAAATAARIALFLPGAVTTVVFPRFAATQGRGPVSRRILGVSLAVVGGLGLVAAAVIAVLPRLVIRVLFGSSFGSGAAVVGTLAVAAACLGLVGLLTYYHLARRSMLAQLGWAGAASAGVGIGLIHAHLEPVALVMLVVTGAILGLSLLGVAHGSMARGRGFLWTAAVGAYRAPAGRRASWPASSTSPRR